MFSNPKLLQPILLHTEHNRTAVLQVLQHCCAIRGNISNSAEIALGRALPRSLKVKILLLYGIQRPTEQQKVLITMTPLFGSTRSVVTSHYALLTPAGLVSAPIPGWRTSEAYVVIAPPLGARFTQLLLTLGPDGGGDLPADHRETFFYVREGAVRATVGEREELLEVGGFCFSPAGQSLSVRSVSAPAKLIVFQRAYVARPDTPLPPAIFANEDQYSGAPFMGDESAILKVLLPDSPDFDMAVNIFTFQPGATLPIVETHIMEHGLQMIQGQGIYRLASDWHPVQDGDVIWMAAYCPQWFVATGKTPARYIYYKDVNREPIV